jgi:uroporphyrinogen III methyltransferase/synthase
MNRGRVVLVGAGPGDPGLLTLRGREVLAEAEVVVYDALLGPRLLDFAPPEAERIDVGKRAGKPAPSQEEIHRILIDRAQKGRRVVRLKGGDPFVFGRGGEEALALAEAGIDFEVVPGVTAAVAAAAYAGIPLTHRKLASGVALVTGHEADDKSESALDWDALARWKGTLVFYMGVANFPTIAANLIAHGLGAETPAAVIHWGTTPRQKVVMGTLRALPEAAAAADLKPPALIVIGAVVALRDRLKWFEKRPLLGRRIVVTRARPQASGLAARLEALGAETISSPAIRIEPPDDPAPLREAVRSAAAFDLPHRGGQAAGRHGWIVFTSPNGVEAFFAAMKAEGLDARALGGAGRQVAAIGPATAARLAAFGIRADLEPETFTSAALAEALAARQDLRGVPILLLRADIAPKDLGEALAARGAAVHEVTAYRTVADLASREAARALLDRGEADWITFTSSSTVKYFLEAVGAPRIRSSGARIASIGQVTSAAVREAGLDVTVEADPHTMDGLVDAIVAREASG